MSTLIIAGCVILKNDKLLLIRKKGKDVWELPGGYVKDADEEQTAKDKTWSQIGVEPSIIQQFTTLEFQKDGQNIETPIFECEIDTTATFRPGINIEEIKWFALKEVSKEKLGSDVEAILEEL